MNYVYPRLSEHDWSIVRLGGAGLGNIMFAWARAMVFARDHQCQMIWPTWPSIKLGPILRGEQDKRFYGDLFRSQKQEIHGLEKIWKRIQCAKIPESEKESIHLCDETIVEFTGFEGCFEEILYDYEYVKGEIIAHLRKKNRRPLADNLQRGVGIHVRLGDFGRVSEEEVKNGRHDSALPIFWYVEMAKQIQSYAGADVPIYVFSDGTEEELAPLLAVPGVVRKGYGTSIADIVALSCFPVLVASGSSFSMWARYLGRANCICYPNQRKQQILTPGEEQFEIEVEAVIPEEYGERIREIYRK